MIYNVNQILGILNIVADFFAQRAKNMLLDKGIWYDVVDAVLAAPVNAFFDAVMVMDKDEKVKNNRLALLNEVKKQVNQVADLSQLVMK